METSDSSLFAALGIRDITFRNRIAGFRRCANIPSVEDGFASDWYLRTSEAGPSAALV